MKNLVNENKTIKSLKGMSFKSCTFLISEDTKGDACKARTHLRVMPQPGSYHPPGLSMHWEGGGAEEE